MVHGFQLLEIYQRHSSESTVGCSDYIQKTAAGNFRSQILYLIMTYIIIYFLKFDLNGFG